MFTFSVRIFPLILSRSWAQGLVIVLYKIYKEVDPGLARRNSLLCPSEETALFLFPAGLFFPYTCRFRLTKANICIFQNCRVSVLQQLRAKSKTLTICQQALLKTDKNASF